MMLSTGFNSLDFLVGGFLRDNINLVLFDNSFSRNFFIWKTVSSCLNRGGLVHYVDLDTIFTAYLEHEAKPRIPVDDLLIFNPSQAEINDVISRICSIRVHCPDLVVFDSVNMFYNLFQSGISFGELNRMLGVYLSLLQSFSTRMNTVVLITSLARAKKTDTASSSWSQSYPGGRVLTGRSGLIMSITVGVGYLRVRMEKHPNLILTGTVHHLRISSV
jgi:hypothetical protein